MRNKEALVTSASILFIMVVSILSVCKAKKNCMQSGMGPADLYNNGVMNPQYMWYRVRNKVQVPVVLDPDYTHQERRIILGGLYEIQYKTCIDFYIFNNTHVLEGYDFVYITKAKTGCWSHVGRVGNGGQELSLGKGCVNHRTAVHEMIHALGFAHEHVRSDRDNYVYIFWQNISPGRESNFAKRDTKSTDPFGPYDYQSIMHYDRTSFSHNGLDTIKPLKRSAKIGTGRSMSPWDVKKLLRMYNCEGHSSPPRGHGHSNSHSHGLPPAYDAVSHFIDNKLHDLEDDETQTEADDENFSDPEENSATSAQHPTKFLQENTHSLGYHHRTLTHPEGSTFTQNSPAFSYYNSHNLYAPMNFMPYSYFQFS